MHKIDIASIKLPKLSEEEKIGSSPTKQVEAMGDEEFESFVLEWLKFCRFKDANFQLYRVGGTNDHGLDLIICNEKEEIAYQCKHYSKKLNKSIIRDIIIKILWYYFKDFNQQKYPAFIFIIALNDFSIEGARYLSDHEAMCKDCCNSYVNALDNEDITRTKKDEDAFKNYLISFDYKTVSHILLSTIVAEYYKSEYGFLRFRKEPVTFSRVRINKSEYEPIFVKQVDQSLNESHLSIEDKQKYIELAKSDFYSAISLKETCFYLFGNYDEFMFLEKEIADYLFQRQFDTFKDNFSRMNCLLSDIGGFSLESSFLNYSLHMVTYADKKGTCHLVVNDGKFFWYK